MSEVIAFRPRPSADPAWSACPWSEELSDYDRCSLYLYARLLHDESEGADILDLARDVFGLSPWFDSQRAFAIVQSHLKRAHWIADNYFPMLGW